MAKAYSLKERQADRKGFELNYERDIVKYLASQQLVAISVGFEWIASWIVIKVWEGLEWYLDNCEEGANSVRSQNRIFNGNKVGESMVRKEFGERISCGERLGVLISS